MKDKKPNKPEKGGYDKGEYRWRSLESNPNIVVTVQKDSKVMTYASNFIAPEDKSTVNRYCKFKKATEQMQC